MLISKMSISEQRAAFFQAEMVSRPFHAWALSCRDSPSTQGLLGLNAHLHQAYRGEKKLYISRGKIAVGTSGNGTCHLYSFPMTNWYLLPGLRKIWRPTWILSLVKVFWNQYLCWPPKFTIFDRLTLCRHFLLLQIHKNVTFKKFIENTLIYIPNLRGKGTSLIWKTKRELKPRGESYSWCW